MKNLLIFAPHPDDEAIACGGLISKAFRNGWTIHVVVCGIGDCRQLVTGNTEPTGRLKELSDASNLGGYSTEVLFVGQEFMRLDTLPRKVLCDMFEDVIEKFRPDIVVIPPASSYDQDHRAVAQAAMTALRPRPATLRFVVRTVLEADEPYYWRVSGERPTPNMFLSLTLEDLETKRRLVLKHASQNRPDPFGRSLENLERMAFTYGCEIGGGAAEAYRILKTDGQSIGI